MVYPYYRCLENSIIEGKQCIISWYVDNTKVSHVDKDMNARIIEMISEQFGELTIFRGGKHKFLGMNIDFF